MTTITILILSGTIIFLTWLFTFVHFKERNPQPEAKCVCKRGLKLEQNGTTWQAICQCGYLWKL